MKPYQKVEKGGLGNVIVGTVPKVSIDSRCAMNISYSKESELQNLLSSVDSPKNATLAFAAAQKIFEQFEPAFRHIEVIRISFYWNRNNHHGPLIVASVVIVDPVTDEKARVEALEPVWYPSLSFSLKGRPDEEVLSSLVKKLVTATRKQIDIFRNERESLALAAQHLDSLFAQTPQ